MRRQVKINLNLYFIFHAKKALFRAVYVAIVNVCAKIVNVFGSVCFLGGLRFYRRIITRKLFKACLKNQAKAALSPQ